MLLSYQLLRIGWMFFLIEKMKFVLAILITVKLTLSKEPFFLKTAFSLFWKQFPELTVIFIN